MGASSILYPGVKNILPFQNLQIPFTKPGKNF